MHREMCCGGHNTAERTKKVRKEDINEPYHTLRTPIKWHLDAIRTWSHLSEGKEKETKIQSEEDWIKQHKYDSWSSSRCYSAGRGKRP